MRNVPAFVFTALVILLSVLASSCSIIKDVPAIYEEEAEQEIVLRFISSWGGVDSKAGTLQEVLNRFMDEHRSIRVVNESLFGEDFLPKIKTDFASGNDPDVFGLWPGSDIRALIGAGKVADLTDVLEADRQWKENFKGMWDYTTFDGKTYGLPVEVILECLFINRDLFEKYEVDIPESYEDLKTAVIAFRENNIIPIAYNSQAEGTFLYQNLIVQLGDKNEAENPLVEGAISPCYMEAMDYMRELYQLGAFPGNFISLTNSERNNLFKQKKAAMIVQGSWFFGEFSDDDGSVDIIPFPYIGEKPSSQSKIIYGLGCGVFYASSKAFDDMNKKEAAISLLKTLTSDDTTILFAQKTGMISNIRANGNDNGYSRLTLKGIEMIEKAGVLVGPPDSFVDRTAWEERIVENFPYILEGRKTPRDLWNEYLLVGGKTR